MADVTESDQRDDVLEETDVDHGSDLPDVDVDFGEDFPEDFDEDDLAEELDAPVDDGLGETGLADDDLPADDPVDDEEPVEDDALALDPETLGPDDEVEALREGEFVCSSCHMAKRESALADPDELLCRDCV